MLLAAAIAVMVATGCHKKTDEQPDFDRGIMLAGIAANVALPAYQSFITVSDSLLGTLQVLQAQPTIAHLASAQAQWVATARAWKVCQLFNLGLVSDQYLQNRIHTWPVKTAFVDEFIADTGTLTEAFIDTKGSSSKGLAAIEYLLFSPAGNAVTMDSLTGWFGARRLQYMTAVAQNMCSTARQMNDLWRVDGGNYYGTFVSATAVGVEGSTNIFVNKMIEYLEYMLNTKIGKPIGKQTGAEMNAELQEAWRSNTSVTLLKANLETLKQAFHGGTQSTDKGIDDYLNAVNARYDDGLLTAKIDSQFYAISAVYNKLSENLLASNAQDVEKAWTETRALLVLFKVDVVSNLSITLTLNDNDGD